MGKWVMTDQIGAKLESMIRSDNRSSIESMEYWGFGRSKLYRVPRNRAARGRSHTVQESGKEDDLEHEGRIDGRGLCGVAKLSSKQLSNQLDEQWINRQEECSNAAKQASKKESETIEDDGSARQSSLCKTHNQCQPDKHLRPADTLTFGLGG